MKLTKAQGDALTEYVTVMQHALGLDHWDLRVSRKKPKGDAIAASFIRDRSPFSTLYFRPSIFDDREEARRDVIHELLHCHLQHWSVDWDEAVRRVASRETADVIVDAQANAEERIIEALAIALADRFPLPDWPEPL